MRSGRAWRWWILLYFQICFGCSAVGCVYIQSTFQYRFGPINAWKPWIERPSLSFYALLESTVWLRSNWDNCPSLFMELVMCILRPWSRKNQLQAVEVPFTLSNLIGGYSFRARDQQRIAMTLKRFLVNTDKLMISWPNRLLACYMLCDWLKKSFRCETIFCI